MKKFNILITTVLVTFLSTGCVKPTQDTQPIYTDGTQPIVYEEAQPIVYDPNVGTTVTTSNTVGGVTSYPDPYANNGAISAYPDPYASQPVLNDYPVTTSYPQPSASTGQGGGIHLQIAALKDYYTAEDYKNRLSLPPGLSAYVQRGPMNKVILKGIPSLAEANRLKESRFPGAFIIQGGTLGGYTPEVDSTYGGGAYNVNNPYDIPSSTVNRNSDIGVQIGAFSSQGKAQSVANEQNGKYPATVKRIGQYYKVILTGFSTRSVAKAYASRVGGFVVSFY